MPTSIPDTSHNLRPRLATTRTIFSGAMRRLGCFLSRSSAPNGAALSSQGLVAPGTMTHATRSSIRAATPNGVAVNSHRLLCPWNGPHQFAGAFSLVDLNVTYTFFLPA